MILISMVCLIVVALCNTTTVTAITTTSPQTYESFMINGFESPSTVVLERLWPTEKQ